MNRRFARVLIWSPEPVELAVVDRILEQLMDLGLHHRGTASSVGESDCCGFLRQAITQTKEHWSAQKRGEVQYGDSKLPRLDIKVSKEILPRVFRLLQALFAALETRGHRATATKGRRF
jgi:hypothetical protein